MFSTTRHLFGFGIKIIVFIYSVDIFYIQKEFGHAMLHNQMWTVNQKFLHTLIHPMCP